MSQVEGTRVPVDSHAESCGIHSFQPWRDDVVGLPLLITENGTQAPLISHGTTFAKINLIFRIYRSGGSMTVLGSWGTAKYFVFA